MHESLPDHFRPCPQNTWAPYYTEARDWLKPKGVSALTDRCGVVYCNGPNASSAKDCPVWQKEEIQCVRVEKRISFPAVRQLVEVKMPTVISGGKTYAAAASTRRESKSVQCQTSLTWVFSERPLRTTESNVRSSGGPGSVPTGTQASSGKARMVSADAWVPCESVKCSSETDRGSADPPKTASRGSANFTKWHLRVLRLPSKAHLRVQQVS